MLNVDNSDRVRHARALVLTLRNIEAVQGCLFAIINGEWRHLYLSAVLL